MAVTYYTENVKLPANLRKKAVSLWIGTVAAGYGKKIGSVAYLFCSDEKILEVNREYLQHDYYTDIITFDYTEEDTLSGDLYISLDTVWSNSEKFRTDYPEELLRVIIHGILHLCGINDKTPEAQLEMTDAENKALALFPQESRINKSK
ncbi:MAG: rRNA maturation RNase YbeY [Prevotellaceae bacterium]|jgi:rRNA maturation RNase YbeY|nr:rRNA maturation RNase YbeY [Prevotellaceae bacterium]